MGVGPIGGATVAFGIKAVADLRGVDQTSKALANLSREGANSGTGIAQGQRQAQSALADTARSADVLHGRLENISKVGLAIGAGAFAGLGFAVAQASDLAESASKVGVVFGDAAGEIEDFASTAAESLGITRQQALETTATFGNLFRGMQIGPDVAADMSTVLVQLSADLASFNNVDATQVLDDLRSGLVGEAEPLRKYGILINEAAVETELLRSGVRKINGEWTEAQKVQARYNIIMAQTTTAQGDFARTSDGAANSIRIARAQFADAAAQLGTALLPAVSAAARAVGSLAGAFNALPDGVKNVAAIGIAVAGGLGILAAVAARLVLIGQTLAPAWTRVAGSLTATGAAGRSAASGLALVGTSAEASTSRVGGLLTGLKGLAALGVITVAVDLAMDDLQLATKGGDPGWAADVAFGIAGGIADAFDRIGIDSLSNRINDAIDASVTGLEVQQRALDLGFTLNPKILGGGPDDALINEIGFTIQELQKIASGMGVEFDVLLSGISQFLPELRELNVTWADARALSQAAGLSMDDWVKQAITAKRAADQAALAQAGLARETKDATPAIDDQTGAIADQTDALAAQVDEKIAGTREQERLTRAVRDTLNAQFLAGQNAKGLFLPFTRDAENAEQATAQFNRTLDETTAAALNTERGIEDIAPSLAGMQAGFGKAGQSVTDMVRAMDDVGVLDLSPSMREALDLSSALIKVEADIAGVEAAITNNQQDLAMWQGRIDLVSDTFGIASDALADWLGQLERGEITQQQFNDAVAGLGANGGFPKLDALLAQGKISQEEYAAAVEAGTHLIQRSAGALSDEEAEIVRNIIALDGYVRSHDQADGAVTNLTEAQRGFVAAMADSKVQTFLQTLQLLTYLATTDQIPAEKVTQFIADSSAADPVIAAVIDDLGLLGEGKTVPIDADKTDYDNAVDDVTKEEIPDKTVRIKPALDGTGIGDLSTLGETEPDINVTQPDPIVFTAEDEATPVANTVSANIAAAATGAGNAAAEAGTAITDGFAGGMAGAQIAVTNGLVAIQNTITNAGSGFYNFGFNPGYNFGVGVANGITATANAVYNAAFNVGYMAHLGTQAGMQAHSPSKLALASGKNWGESVAAGILGQIGTVRSAGEQLSKTLQDTIADPTTNAAMRGVLTVDNRPAAIIADSAVRGGGRSSVTNSIGSVSITVQDAGNPQATADLVVTQLYRSFDRGESAGIFRR